MIIVHSNADRNENKRLTMDEPKLRFEKFKEENRRENCFSTSSRKSEKILPIV